MLFSVKNFIFWDNPFEFFIGQDFHLKWSILKSFPETLINILFFDIFV